MQEGVGPCALTLQGRSRRDAKDPEPDDVSQGDATPLQWAIQLGRGGRYCGSFTACIRDHETSARYFSGSPLAHLVVRLVHRQKLTGIGEEAESPRRTKEVTGGTGTSAKPKITCLLLICLSRLDCEFKLTKAIKLAVSS